jgi:hypothetical protein
VCGLRDGGRVACQEQGTLSGFLPASWDHLVASGRCVLGWPIAAHAMFVDVRSTAACLGRSGWARCLRSCGLVGRGRAAFGRGRGRGGPQDRLYVQAAQEAGLSRDSGPQALSHQLIAVGAVHLARPHAHGASWETLLINQERIRTCGRGKADHCQGRTVADP